MDKVLTSPALIKGIRALNDGGVSITFHTNELPVEDMAKWLTVINQFGWVCFKAGEVALLDTEVPTDDPTDERKTPAQRLRNVLFVANKQNGYNDDFQAFYRNQMEKIIDDVKKKFLT